MKLKILIFVAFSCFGIMAKTSDRIQVIEHNLSEVSKIYVAPGRSTMMDFPCDIDRVVESPTGDYQTSFDKEDNPRGIDLWLVSHLSRPTDLKVRCSNDDVYVFDVIPSVQLHHELIRIKRGYSRPQIKNLKLGKVTYSSDEFIKSKKSESKTMKLRGYTDQKGRYIEVKR